VSILTNQPTQRSASKYWSVLKVRMKKEGNQLTTNCRQLKMTAEDGKRRKTDVADTEQLRAVDKGAVKQDKKNIRIPDA